jgi:hypothetical protein
LCLPRHRQVILCSLERLIQLAYKFRQFLLRGD